MSDSPFCEHRLGGEFGIFGMGAYIVGEYGFGWPLITFKATNLYYESSRGFDEYS